MWDHFAWHMQTAAQYVGLCLLTFQAWYIFEPESLGVYRNPIKITTKQD